MFKKRSVKQHELALALVSSIVKTNANSKGRGAERMEAMAQVVAALDFNEQSIDTVEIGWQVIDGEYCPTLKMQLSGETVKEIVQIER